MKKIIIGVLLAAICLLFVVKVFSFYNKSHIMSNEAVFQIYMKMNNGEIDEYFGLKKGTYNNQKQVIICELPVTTTGFKPKEANVKFDINSINCEEEYSQGKYTKYDNTELNDNDAKLYILKNSSVSTHLFNEDLMKDLVIASKTIKIDYARGKINNVVIEKDKVYNFCDK